MGVYEKSPLFDQSLNEVQFARMNASHNTDSNQGSLSVNENTLEVSLIDVESLVKNEGPEKVSGMMKTNEIFVLNINKQNNKASVNFFSGAEPPIKNPKLISKIKVSSDSEHTKPTSPYSPNLKSPRVQEEQAHYKVHSDEKNAHEETSFDYAVDIPATHSYSKEEEEVLLNSVQQIAAKNGVLPPSAEEDLSELDLLNPQTSDLKENLKDLVNDFLDEDDLIDDETPELLDENDHTDKYNLIDDKTSQASQLPEEKTHFITPSAEKTPNLLNVLKKMDTPHIGVTNLERISDFSQKKIEKMFYFEKDLFTKDDFSKEQTLKPLINILHDHEKFHKVTRDKCIVMAEEKDGKTEIKVDEKWHSEFQLIERLSIEHKNGEKKVLQNDGIEPAFVIKVQTHEEMIEIATTVHYVALRLFEENKIELENKKDESITQTQTSSYAKQDTPQQANLKRPLPPHVEHSHRKEKKLSIGKTSQAILRLLQETAIAEKHRHEDKERKELEEAIKLHQWIILKDVLDFDLKQENIKKDSQKNSLIKQTV